MLRGAGWRVGGGGGIGPVLPYPVREEDRNLH